jgi:hypothetical protein
MRERMENEGYRCRDILSDGRRNGAWVEGHLYRGCIPPSTNVAHIYTGRWLRPVQMC